MAEVLTGLGHRVTSTWFQNVLPETSTTEELEKLWVTNWRELQECDVFLLLHYPGGKETYVEMGRALSLSKLVLIYQPAKEPLPLSHVASPRMVKVVLSLERALEVIGEYQPNRPVLLYNLGSEWE